MKNFTNVSLFSDFTSSEEQNFYETVTQFVGKIFYQLPQMIGESYSETNDELEELPPHARRRNSRPVRVNEKISQKCAKIYPEYFREIADGKFFLYKPGIAQFHIVKTNNGKLPPRRTQQAKNEVFQQNLPFKDCPIVHIGHDCRYGHVTATLMFYKDGRCVWNCSFSDILCIQNHEMSQNVLLSQVGNEAKEVFAKPKTNIQKRNTEKAV